MKDYFAVAAKRAIPLVLLGKIALSAGATVAAELQLVMVEQPGCHWCARWNSEIAPIYPKTPEAAAAPLVRHRLGAPLPDGIRLARPAQFTPTFVLIADGDEVGRIEGYPGADFFWSLLADLIDRAEAAPE